MHQPTAYQGLRIPYPVTLDFLIRLAYAPGKKRVRGTRGDFARALRERHAKIASDGRETRRWYRRLP